MKQYTYHSKNDHVVIKLDVYGPKEVWAMVKRNVNKFKEWQHTPRNKRRKLFEFRIERK